MYPSFCKTFFDSGYIIPLTLLAAVISKSESFQDSAHTLYRLQEAVYEQRWREFPEYATFSGFHDYDDELESYTLDAYKRRKENCEEILRQANELDEETLSREDRRELKILRSYLQSYIDGYKWRDYGALNPINFLESLTKGPQWTVYCDFETEQDFNQYLKRLSAVPRQIEEKIQLMKRAIKLKRTSHRVSVDRVPSNLRNWDLEKNFFFPLQAGLELSSLDDDIKEKIWLKGKESIKPISEAFKKLQKFMDKEYMAATRPVEGVHYFSNGYEYYKACLKWYLWYDVSPEEIFDTGVKEVARIERQMKKVMQSVGFDGDLKSFFNYVKYIPKFYNHTKNQLLNRYVDIINNQIQPKLKFLFKNITLPQITVVPIESDGPWGSYGQNMFYANLKDATQRSTFMMRPLALHEADPGHRYQEVYASNFPIPKYRAESISNRLYSVPFHFPVFSAYVEGWALYAEYLGEEMGLYEDPYDLFGRYCSEMFRACRLVIDTGIHAFGWTKERAITFLSNYSDFPDSQITSEVDRYITWPGQACSYKIGEMKFKQLRGRAESLLGRQFEVREFHDVVLKIGSVPLNILEDVVDEWIDNKMATVTSETITQSAAAVSSATCYRSSAVTVLILISVVTLFGFKR